MKKGKKTGNGDGGDRVGGEGDKQGCREEKTKGGTRRDRGRDGCLGEGPARPEGETREVERGRRTRLALTEKEELEHVSVLFPEDAILLQPLVDLVVDAFRVLLALDTLSAVVDGFVWGRGKHASKGIIMVRVPLHVLRNKGMQGDEMVGR